MNNVKQLSSKEDKILVAFYEMHNSFVRYTYVTKDEYNNMKNKGMIEVNYSNFIFHKDNSTNEQY